MEYSVVQHLQNVVPSQGDLEGLFSVHSPDPVLV